MAITTAKQCTDLWAILGLGSIGSLWASRFLNKNISVELIFRDQARLDTIKDKGLTLSEVNKSITYLPDHLVTCDMAGQPIDNLLITTKAQQTLTALNNLAHRIDKNTKLILLQNGMGVAEEIQKQLPLNPLFLGITTEGAYRTTPNCVVSAGKGDTWLGPANAQKLPAFSTLQRVNQDCFWDEDIYPRLWQKFAINCAINGLTVLFQCKNGELLKNDKAYKKMKSICREVELVLNKKGIQLSEDLFKTASNIAEKTADNYSSMLQDFHSQRDLELPYLNTYLCRQATTLNVDTPHNQALIEAINLLIEKQRSGHIKSENNSPFT